MTSHRSVPTILLSTLMTLIAAGIFSSAETAVEPIAPAVACPSPTHPRGGGCVLLKDETLATTLRLPSSTQLNCRGHKLSRPLTDTVSGLEDRSSPEVGIFLDHAENVLIQNCVIEGFDFGIFAINNKVRPIIKANPRALALVRNKILQNTINARFLAISLASFDNTEIKDNTITYTTAGGKGIYVGRDSDINSIIGNKITGDIAVAGSPAVGAPGTDNPTTNPPVTAGQAVLITQTLGPEPTLMNAIIEGELFQLPVLKSATANEKFSGDNRFEGNVIAFTQVPTEGVVISIAQRTTVRGNQIRFATNSIRLGIQSGKNGLSKTFHGKCTEPVGRLCLANSDCTGGACSDPVPSAIPVFWVTDGTVIEGNTVTGPFNTGISTNGTNTRIRGNTIVGPLRIAGAGPGPGQGAIILIAKFGLGPTTTVSRNFVTDVATALLFSNRPAQLLDMEAEKFEAHISLNDFICYTTSIRSDIAANVSHSGPGNFWGFPCPKVSDRTSLLPKKVVTVGPILAQSVRDAHPYDTSIAKVFGSAMPEPCQ
ncbi:MAG TPA: NosD domain-containing protein [Pyrinomonadaceae bacterium]|nr:NosD domain-containing protein [Pyrinomonadaceae bacterium]